MKRDHQEDETERVPEIAIVGDLTEHESELTERLLDVPPGANARSISIRPAEAPTAPCR